MDDPRGVPVSTDDPNNLEMFEAALRTLNTYNGDAVALIDAALDALGDYRDRPGCAKISEWATSMWESFELEVAV